MFSYTFKRRALATLWTLARAGLTSNTQVSHSTSKSQSILLCSHAVFCWVKIHISGNDWDCGMPQGGRMMVRSLQPSTTPVRSKRRMGPLW